MEQRYETKVQVTDVQYSFKLSTQDCTYYSVNARSISNSIDFSIWPECEDGENILVDDYIDKLWSSSIENDFNGFLRGTGLADVYVRGKPNSTFFSDDELPSYKEFTDELEIHIDIIFDRKFLTEYEEVEYKEMYRSLEHFKMQDYKIKSISFKYTSINETTWSEMTIYESDNIDYISTSEILKSVIRTNYAKVIDDAIQVGTSHTTFQYGIVITRP